MTLAPANAITTNMNCADNLTYTDGASLGGTVGTTPGIAPSFGSETIARNRRALVNLTPFPGHWEERKLDRSDYACLAWALT